MERRMPARCIIAAYYTAWPASREDIVDVGDQSRPFQRHLATKRLAMRRENSYSDFWAAATLGR